MNHPTIRLTRRTFLAHSALVGAGAMFWNARAFGEGAGEFRPPVAIFSKVYQELKLDFEQSADLTAEAGLDGIDCPVRKAGQIEPERAADELPRYADVLDKRKLKLLLIATDIVNVDSPHTHDVLAAARKLGVRLYRLGFIPADGKVAEVKAQLKDLAALNKELGMTGLLENHTKPVRLGGDLNQMHDVVNDFDPDQIGVAFDIGHAIIEHGDDWPTHFERLKSHIRVAYVKDVKRPDKFVPFGQGEFSKTDFFKRLHAMNLTAPMSIHIEFDWSNGGKDKTRETMLAAVKASNAALHKWLSEA